MKRNKKALIFVVISLVVTGLYAKSKKTVEKYVHPRNYTIDLSDSETKPVFLYDGEELKAELVFSQFLKEDMPRAGDRIKFVFSASASKNLGEVSGSIFDRSLVDGTTDEYSYIPVADDESKIFNDYVKKNTVFKGVVYFFLTSDVENELTLILKSDLAENWKKLNKTGMKFNRVTKSVDTVKELENLKNAEKKNIEIVEVKTDFYNSFDDSEDDEDFEDYDVESEDDSDDIEVSEVSEDSEDSDFVIED